MVVGRFALSHCVVNVKAASTFVQSSVSCGVQKRVIYRDIPAGRHMIFVFCSVVPKIACNLLFACHVDGIYLLRCQAFEGTFHANLLSPDFFHTYLVSRHHNHFIFSIIFFCLERE